MEINEMNIKSDLQSIDAENSSGGENENSGSRILQKFRRKQDQQRNAALDRLIKFADDDSKKEPIEVNQIEI